MDNFNYKDINWNNYSTLKAETEKSVEWKFLDETAKDHFIYYISTLFTGYKV